MEEEQDEGEGGERRTLPCSTCGHEGLYESDGFYYCEDCGAQADIIQTGVADEGGSVYDPRFTRRPLATPSSAPATPAAALSWFRFTQEQEKDEPTVKREKVEEDYYYVGADGVVGPTEPEDFGSGSGMRALGYADYYNEVRVRYVMGLQWMVQMQCEALVERFKVSPLVCGVAGSIWLRYLESAGVFRDGWADAVFLDSETPTAGEQEDHKFDVKHARKNCTTDGRHAIMVWFWNLRKTIPLSSSLAVSYLACHVAREAILPTDILKWSLEGKLPYFAAHVEIERRFERPSPACPISLSLMFRPYQTPSAQRLESMAASIAESIGLHLPPVNFFEIASRFLNQLSLPVDKILPHACHLYEWSTPPDLWMSTNDLRLPTRVCVLSILIVSIRILYGVNGFGAWEGSLSNFNCSPSSCHKSGLDSISGETGSDAEQCSYSPHMEVGSEEKSRGSPSAIRNSEFDSAEILNALEKMHNKIGDTNEYMKDLRSYLQYCKDVVFVGSGQSNIDNLEEEELIEKFWDFYLNETGSMMEEDQGVQDLCIPRDKRSRTCDAENLLGSKKIRAGYEAGNMARDSLKHDYSSDKFQVDQNSDQGREVSKESLNAKAIRKLKLEMEENRFCYIPPRVNLKRFDYLHYERKRDEGALTYVAHADYYILLRACARLAQVDVRIMHYGVLGFERRLAWLEERIDHCLHLRPPNITCDFCVDVPDQNENDHVRVRR